MMIPKKKRRNFLIFIILRFKMVEIGCPNYKIQIKIMNSCLYVETTGETEQAN